MNENCTTVPPSTETPSTFLTLPREIRDDIYTHAILSSTFTFLLTCRQLNEEGTPLLYKHGIYHIRALTLRNECKLRKHLPAPYKPPPFHLIQNLYITMPPTAIGEPSRNYEVPRRTVSLLECFRVNEIRRRVCHVNMQSWILSAGLARGLGGLMGFEVVRVEVLFCVRLIDERLGPALDKVE